MLNLECLVVLHAYELRSTYSVDCDSKCLPHGGIVVYLMCSCAAIIVLVICWNSSSSFAFIV